MIAPEEDMHLKFWVTAAMVPIPVAAYVRLIRTEGRSALAEFGED